MPRAPRIKPAHLKASLAGFVASTAVLCAALLFAAVRQDTGKKLTGPPTPPSVETGPSTSASTERPSSEETGPSASASTERPPSVVAEWRGIENLYVVEAHVGAPAAWPFGCNFQEVGSVYGFALGKHELEGEDPLKTAKEVRLQMSAMARGHVLKGLVLVGRVDRIPFDAQGKGRNKALALARVESFRDWAFEELKGIEGSATAVSGAASVAAGPLDLPSEEDCPDEEGVECDASERRHHRSVDIFACWAPKRVQLDGI